MCPDNVTTQAKILRLALGLNLAMFVIGLAAGLAAHSSALIADSLDMLADAAAYAVALLAQRRGTAFKLTAARTSGYVLMVLGGAVLIDVARRAIFGAEADGTIMSVIASLSLVTNLYVLRKLSIIKGEGIHMRATWIFTRADVVANLCVIASGLVVRVTGFGTIDLIVGASIAMYILFESREIFEAARHSQNMDPASPHLLPEP
jgi:Co/Zn/Cd efflux system component